MTSVVIWCVFIDKTQSLKDQKQEQCQEDILSKWQNTKGHNTNTHHN